MHVGHYVTEIVDVQLKRTPRSERLLTRRYQRMFRDACRRQFDVLLFWATS